RSWLERDRDTVEVWRSNPHSPTITFNGLSEKPENRQPTIQPTTAFIAPFLTAFRLLSGTFPAPPAPHRCLPGCRDQASSEFSNDAGFPAPSSVRPSPCSQASC